MATGLPLLQQLALLGVRLPPWPEQTQSLADSNPNGDSDDGELQRGLAFARVLRQWREQLREGDDSIRTLVAGLCEHRLGQPPLRGWDAWVTVLLLADLRGEKVDDPLLAGVAGISPRELDRAQLVGAALCLIEDRQISAAALAMSWLRRHDTPAQPWRQGLLEAMLRSTGEANAGRCRPDGSARQWLEEVRQLGRLMQLLRELSRDPEEGGPLPFAELDALACGLRTDERSCGTKAGAGARMFWIGEGNRRIQAGESESGYRLLGDLLNPPPQPPPVGADGNAWHQLSINAAARAVAETPRLTLIESKSLPRTGHHHLRRLLLNARGEDFSYCERYQEPGCCQVMPCNAEPWWRHARTRGRDHVRLIKSHDYALDDATYPTPAGVVRLVQVRRPLPLLASWLELKQLNINREMLQEHGINPNRIYLYHEPALVESSWPLIDDFGITMSRQEAVVWLQGKVAYISGFLNKWLPLASPLPHEGAPVRGTFVLRYEDLGARADVLQAIGRDSPHPPGPAPSETRYAAREGSCLHRRSLRITMLLETLQASLAECEAQILGESGRWQHLLGYGPLSATG
jgi:hypothetical protein